MEGSVATRAAVKVVAERAAAKVWAGWAVAARAEASEEMADKRAAQTAVAA